MAVNAYLNQMSQIRQECFVAGCEITAQQMFDLLCLVLNDPEIMGRDTFGAKRLVKIRKALYDREKLYHDAWTFTEESDYLQEKLDAALREIFGENAEKFSERYPLCKTWNYNKRRKGK